MLDIYSRPGPELSVLPVWSHFTFLIPSGGGASIVLKSSRVPKTTLAFDTNFKVQGSSRPRSVSIIHKKDSENPEKSLYSLLRLITAKRYRLRSAKGRGAQGQIWETSRCALLLVLLQWRCANSANF